VLIDLAADFRLENSFDYLKWYKQKHRATNLIKKSLYSIPEINGAELNKYQIISCPGCYPTSILLPLIPLFESN
jgi:N-acetyl-gamma-glutamyl-phosphate reductase